jgi:putative DNA primase/helicase
MSTSEHHARMETLERNPELLREIENAGREIGDHTNAPQQAETNAQSESMSEASAGDDWPNPIPLGGELPAVPPFDLRLLPECLRPLVEDTAERMQVCLDFPAVAAVLCLAGTTNRRARIQPKAADTSWVVTPNLWGGIIAQPGLMKSPVISAITQPLTRIESDWRAEYESATKACEQQQEEAELRRSAWREQYKASAKNGKSVSPRPVDDTAVPKERRLITQDATFESLHKVMADNPAGVFVIRDELTGWLASLDRQGREGERAFYLSAWNGDTPHTIDRIGRGSVYVEACCVSILGGIQPARLRAYLVDALKDGPANDGLMQRFQVLVYPDAAGQWKYVDRVPNSAATSQAKQTYRRLVNVVADSPVLCFASDAQALFVEWLTELEGKVRDDSLHPALVSHLAKYRKLMPSLGPALRVGGRRRGYCLIGTRPTGCRVLRLLGLPRPANLLDARIPRETSRSGTGAPSRERVETGRTNVHCPRGLPKRLAWLGHSRGCA